MGQLGLFGGEETSSREVEPAAAGQALAELARALPASLRMGTSSWSFPGWRGLVWAGEHSEQMLAKKGLGAYARHPLLRTVGVDRTHYAPIDAVAFTAYARAVPADFSFLVKAHEACTLAVYPNHPRYGEQRGQINRLAFDPSYARDAVVAPFVEGLGAQGGVLLFQLAAQSIALLGGSPRKFAEKLYRFLRDLPKGPRYAVEIRNAALLTDDYAKALRAADAVHCFTLLPGMPGLHQQSAVVGRQPTTVIRWMLAPHRDYDSAVAAYDPFDRLVDPDPAARRSIASLVTEATAHSSPTYVIVNNKAEGSSPLSILELAHAL